MSSSVSWSLSGWQSILSIKEVVSESVSEGMQTEPGTEKERRAESHITTVGYQDSVRHGGEGGGYSEVFVPQLHHCLAQRGRRPAFLSGLAEGWSVGVGLPSFDSVAQSQCQQSPVGWSKLSGRKAVGSTEWSLNMAETDHGREGTQTWAEGMPRGIATLATIPPKSPW